jgi:hypothetical protein
MICLGDLPVDVLETARSADGYGYSKYLEG